MTRRSKIWLVVAVLFSLLNLGGAVYAATRGEVLHAGSHAGLLLLGAGAVWLLVPKRNAFRLWRRRDSVTLALPRDVADRVTNIEQAVDALAIEIERIGEGQRFLTRIFTERAAVRAAGEGGAEPIEEVGR